MKFRGHDLSALESLDVDGRLTWAAERFPGRTGIGTSFQHSGMILIDARVRLKLDGIRVYTIDTERLLPETYDFIQTVEKRYGIRIECLKPDPAEIRKMVADHGLYLFFDSREKQEYCCYLRKVKPNEQALDGLDVWITGLRRGQSESRGATPLYEILDRPNGQVLKLNPLYDWPEERIQAEVKKRNIPVHPLYAQGYPSFGCVICTTPIRPGENPRAGRWRWFNAVDDKKECGLHVPESARTKEI
ncbi:phosphoadenylyl-sulfate reductase [bacterium]|nr:phosphoadenylyl-sulfate reductase [bacterium]